MTQKENTDEPKRRTRMRRIKRISTDKNIKLVLICSIRVIRACPVFSGLSGFQYKISVNPSDPRYSCS